MSKIFDVRDYGAVGDGVADDGPAIRRAVAAAMQHEDAIVYLAEGHYRLYGPLRRLWNRLWRLLTRG